MNLVQSAATLSGNQITGNHAVRGGGLDIYYSDGAILRNNQVKLNTASDSGGGLRLEASPATLIGNTVTGNRAAGGGGLALINTPSTLISNAIASNHADFGGGLDLINSQDVALSQNLVSLNEAARGGGLDIYFSNRITLDGNVIISNSATDSGGGIRLEVSTASFTNNIVADNGTTGTGSGLYVLGSALQLRHTTLARNVGGDGRGLYVTNQGATPSTVALTNTIVAGHVTGISVDNGNTISLASTLWHENGTPYSGALTESNPRYGNPVFVNSDVGDYHIRPGSAAIDVGVDARITVDRDGYPRPVGEGYDLGAYELPLALRLSKQASADPARAGAVLTYTLYLTNSGILNLNATVTDTLPNHVSPGGQRAWTVGALAPGTTWTQQVAVTVEKGYTGTLANEVNVTTSEGMTRTFGLTSTVTTSQASGVIPGQDIVLVYVDGQGNEVTVQVPAPAITEPLTLVYTSVPTVTTTPGGFLFAGRAFDLDAFRAGQPLSNFQFQRPVTLTVHYTDTDVAGLNETSLVLYYWNGIAWLDGACGPYDHHPAEHWLQAPICHLSRFALFGRSGSSQTEMYLPIIIRGEK